MRCAPGTEFALSGATVTLKDGTTWQGPLWSLPGRRAKNGRDHLVPLSATAVEILETLMPMDGKGLLFTTTGETPISGLSKAKQRVHDAMLAELQKTDPDYVLAPWSLHDLRRTFTTGLQGLKIPVEVAEQCLNHKSGTRDGVAGIYARYEYLQERTAALEAWARHIDALMTGRANGDNVIQFAGVQA
jgi:integrase